MGCGSAQRRSAERQSETTRTSQSVLTAADYFPTLPGAQWKYAGWGNEFAAYGAWVSHSRGGRAQIVVQSGTQIASVYEVGTERIVRVYRSPESDGASSLLDEDEEAPYVVLERPLVVGHEWSPTNRQESDDGEIRRVERVGTRVSTPAGTFENVVCVRIVRPEGIDSRECYAPGVGLVRSEFLAEEPIVSALSHFSLGEAEADEYLVDPNGGY